LRVVVRAQDARCARDAQALLAAAGVEAAALPGPYRPAPDGEDITIFSAMAAADGDGVARIAVASLKSEQPLLARMIGLRSAAPPALGLHEVNLFTGAVALDAPPKLLAAQIEACTRVAIAEEERTRRFATAADLNVASPQPLEPRKLKALYIGAPSAMFLALERMLAQHDGLVAAAFSSYAGFDHLHDEPFDAVVLNGAQDASTAVSLCAALRRNASLYHMPTMVVTKPGDIATANAAIERGASAVAEANAPCGASLGWLFEAVRRERRRRAAEHDIRALRDLMGDVRTGLFRREPFDAHVTRLARDHHGNGRPMALCVLRVMPAHGAREPEPDVWKRGFNEIASLAGRLMRDGDTGVALGEEFLAVAMPATPLHGAKRTAERIASVAECTAFASGEGGAGPLVFEQSAVELQPGESGLGLLNRALRALDYDPMSRTAN
jgi:two-component system, cell cycle response regulator PopA